MTIVGDETSILDLQREYSAVRVEALDKKFPSTAVMFLELMLDDWKEESLMMKEDPLQCLKREVPKDKTNYNLYKKMGCYWSSTYTT